MVTRTATRAAVAMCLGLVAIALSFQPSWADDAFARITGSNQGFIAGDQPDIKGVVGAKDAIQVFSTGFGISTPPGGKPVPGPFTFLKRFDPASPKLLRAAFTGEILTVEITWFMDFAGAKRKTVTIRLDGATLNSMDASAQLQTADASGFEQLSMSYTKITFTVPFFDPVTGTPAGQTQVCLDVALNKVC